MNIFKKLFNKIFKRSDNDSETWYNDKQVNYDPAHGTPNAEAYISPDTVSISIANNIKHS